MVVFVLKMHQIRLSNKVYMTTYCPKVSRKIKRWESNQLTTLFFRVNTECVKKL